jgi:hypothetical protein
MPPPQTQSLDDLMQQHGAAVAAPPPTTDPLDALMQQHGATGLPNYRQSDTTPNDIDPNTVGTLARKFWTTFNPATLGQLLPFPKALGGSGMDNPLLPSNVLKGMQATKQQADALWQRGDHVGASAKYVESMLPIAGAIMSHWGDQAQTGRWAALAGEVGGVIASAKASGVLSHELTVQYPLANRPGITGPMVSPARQTPVQFAQARGVPLDAATVSDNMAVKGAQALADRSLGGSLVATPANAARAQAMTRVGGELADETGAAATTPELAGTSLRDALTQKMAGHAAEADHAYDRLRALEAQPSNRMMMPLTPQAVDVLPDGQAGQLRRIVHELDAAPFTPRLLQPSGVGGSLEHVPGTGGAGAKVFDDIVQRMSGTSTPTRGQVRAQLETYLGGGPETNAVKAALEVAQARSRAQGGFTVSQPELPPSAMDVPTKYEAARVTSEEMGLPVDLSRPKLALRPLYEQMTRQLPLTQQQANPGLKAIENILTGPDFAPLSQVDRDLSAIKTVAREHGGLAKMAVANLDAAVTTAAKNGGPDVWDALQKGRQATIAKYATSDVLDSLHAEPVKTISALTAPKDAAIMKLRTVAQHVPQATPEIARAYLEDLLDKPNKVAEWNKLGSETKAILFPKTGQAQALDNFFALTDRISRTNVNPSGSGHQAWMGAQGAMFWYDPIHAAETQIAGATVAKLLRSPMTIQALTRGLSMPTNAPMAARTAATLNLVRAAQGAGVVLDLPKAARQTPNPEPQP